MIPIIAVVGYSNSGKTTLIVKLVKELKSRGFRIATIKHHHETISLDVPGKDTWKYSAAGADIVVLASPGSVNIIENTPEDLTLDNLASRITGVDLIIAEGFKRESRLKIEVFRSGVHEKLITPIEQLLAVASDINHAGVPTFALDDATGLVNYLQEKLRLASV